MSCFKTYDIRGRVGIDLDAAIAERIGHAFAQVMAARLVVLGRDCRASSGPLAAAVIRGLVAAGADVLDLGLAGTEEMYHATAEFGTFTGEDSPATLPAGNDPVVQHPDVFERSLLSAARRTVGL